MRLKLFRRVATSVGCVLLGASLLGTIVTTLREEDSANIGTNTYSVVQKARTNYLSSLSKSSIITSSYFSEVASNELVASTYQNRKAVDRSTKVVLEAQKLQSENDLEVLSLAVKHAEKLKKLQAQTSGITKAQTLAAAEMTDYIPQDIAYYTKNYPEYENKSAYGDANSSFYIEEFYLEYPWETFKVDYALQAYIYHLSEEMGLNYTLVLGIIARESRWAADTIGGNSKKYYGLMQVDETCINMVKSFYNDYTLDALDPYDNVLIGMTILSYQIAKTGSEYSGLTAYGIGYGAWKSNCKAGVYTNSCTDKAYKYQKLIASFLTD